MEIITLKNPKIFASNCYLCVSENSFSVIDPSISYDDALKACPKIDALKPEYVLLTHGHVDHFWEIDSYVEKGCKVIISEKDSAIIANPGMNCFEFLEGKIDSYKGDFTIVNDGDTIMIGDTKFSVVATPGHTAGSVSYMTDGVIFTGDTLFAGGVFGRYDLPTSNGAELLHSLRSLFALPEELIIYSGHGEQTTLKMTKHAFFNRREM